MNGREIKYRVWDGRRMNYQQERHASVWEFALECEEMFVNPTFLQYTGLTDTEGNEIYKGDILENQHGERGLVEWGEYCDNEYVLSLECWMWKKGASLLQSVRGMEGIPLSDAGNATFGHSKHELRVIGNRFQHPELLEGDA